MKPFLEAVDDRVRRAFADAAARGAPNPTLLRILNKTIASTPPGGAVFVTAEILRANKIAAA